jgi:hypothetical protein
MEEDFRFMQQDQTRPGDVDRLRADIDAEKGSDKVAFPDLSRSPLGTDDEAGGHRNTTDQVNTAADQELRPAARHAQGPEQVEGRHYTEAKTTSFATLGILMLGAVVIGAAVVLALM